MRYGNATGKWQVKRVLTSRGSYWPFLLMDGVPSPLPTLWMNEINGAANANTAEAYLRDLKLLYEAADISKFSVEERLRSLTAFSRSELRAICRRLVQTGAGKSASKATCARRVESIKSFLVFAFEFYKEHANIGLVEQSQADRNCQRLCNSVSRHLRVAGSAGEGPKRSEILTDIDVAVINKVIHPDSPLNPFKSPAVRFRNYCIFHLVWSTAMRRAELVLLELDDVRLGGSPTVRIRKPSPAIQRRRRDGASMKTVGREVPISAELAGLLEQYREQWRLTAVAPERPSSSFFLSERDGRRLSAHSFNKIVDAVSRVPEVDAMGKRLHPHGMRSTAINAIRRRIVENEAGSTAALTEALAYVGGWSQRSPMVAHYTRAAISERLAKTIMRRESSNRMEEEDERDPF